MINLHKYKGFCTPFHDTSYEFKSVYLYCQMNDIPIIRVKQTEPCPIDYIPCGSIEWCINSLGKKVIPNYYPDWLSIHLHRKIWRSDKWILGEKYFVKPADRHKRFDGFCTFGTYSKKKKPPYWYSEIVNFTNEWRYYVTNGEILCGKWYWGDEVNRRIVVTPDAPELYIHVPKSFSGTLDFGTFEDGTLALVEAHEPFGCGWYGDKEDETYMQWLIDGWMYMKKDIPIFLGKKEK